jgi:hypothetical protein
MTGAPLLVVDGANVVGSVPDGWWRDRRGAAERLRDALVPLASTGLPADSGAPEWAVGVPLDVLLVVEGAARGIAPVPGVRVEAAPASGDDLITDLVAQAHAADPDRPILAVTADRELRRRVTAAGASYIGPRAVRGQRGR